jgi:hypothetical protein
MPTRTRAAAAVVVLLLGVSACGSDDTVEDGAATSLTPTATTTPTTTAAASLTYESTRHPFRVAIPEDWQLTSVDGTWTSFDQFVVGEAVPGEEVLGTPDRATFLVVNSMVLADGVSPEQWAADFAALVGEATFEGCARTTGEGSVDGEPAVVAEDACNGDILVGRSLVHGGRGWYFTTRGADDPTTVALLDDVAASIDFTEG